MPRTISGDLFRFHLADANDSRITFINKFYILNMIGLTNAWIHISIWVQHNLWGRLAWDATVTRMGSGHFPKLPFTSLTGIRGQLASQVQGKIPGIPHSQSRIFFGSMGIVSLMGRVCLMIGDVCFLEKINHLTSYPMILKHVVGSRVFSSRSSCNLTLPFPPWEVSAPSWNTPQAPGIVTPSL